jgi:sugar O-acyltransferase (sialic acid O-acetyltransferase NeuD family)
MADPGGLLLYGADGFGREVAAWAEEASWDGEPVRVLGFIDDRSRDALVNGREAWPLDEAARRHPGACFVATVGGPDLREALATRAEAAGFRAAPPLIHPSVRYDHDHVRMGDGTVIAAGTTLTTNLELGRHVQINLHCTVAHDVTVGDFGTLSPGCHVSGRVRVGSHAFVGTGAIVLNGEPGRPLVIGDRAVIGAGAVVLGDVEAGSTVFGVPARPMLRPSPPA